MSLWKNFDRSHQTPEGEHCVILRQNAALWVKKWQGNELQEHLKEIPRFSPRVSRDNMTPIKFWCQTLSLQNCKDELLLFQVTQDVTLCYRSPGNDRDSIRKILSVLSCELIHVYYMQNTFTFKMIIKQMSILPPCRGNSTMLPLLNAHACSLPTKPPSLFALSLPQPPCFHHNLIHTQ